MSNQNKNRADTAHKNTQRPARIPMTAGNKLHVPDSLKKEGYQQYWQVDRPGVIDQMIAAYWEKVTDDNGKHVTVPAGEGDTLYLMQIEQQYYEEDMKRQQDLNINTTNTEAQRLGDSEYVPMGKDKVVEREII